MNNFVWVKLPVEYLEKMKEIASTEIVDDPEDFNVQDYCGGNYDDAYDMGYETGAFEQEIQSAEEFLNSMEDVRYEH